MPTVYKLYKITMSRVESLGFTSDHSCECLNFLIFDLIDAGVTTIAGGKSGKGGGHVDGRSEDAKFSSDFDVVYLGSSCSLLVIDRGYKAIREIQLPFDDCAYNYDSGFPLGILISSVPLHFHSRYDMENTLKTCKTSLYRNCCAISSRLLRLHAGIITTQG